MIKHGIKKKNGKLLIKQGNKSLRRIIKKHETNTNK